MTTTQVQLAGTRMDRLLPRWLTVIAACVTVFNLGMSLVGGIVTGISWDERVHGLMLQAWLEGGRYWLAEFDHRPMRFVYGPIGDLVGHLFAIASRSEGLKTVGFTSEAFASRHVAVTSISALGVLASALVVRLLFQSTRFSILTASILTSIPMWTGHAMFNMKDICVASGYAWVTLGLIGIWQTNVLQSSWRQLVGFGGAVAFGAVLALGTRTAMWLPIVASAALMLLMSLLSGLWQAGPQWQSFVRRLLSVAGSLLVAYALLILIYPAAWAPSSSGPWIAVAESADFKAWKEETPWWYIPNWFVHQLPLLLLVFSLIALASTLIVMTRLILRKASAGTDNSSWFPYIFLVILQAFAMPVVAVVARSPLYDGVRHFLLVLPALSILATVGVGLVLKVIGGRSRIVFHATIGVATAALLLPTLEQARLFPYNYAYFNVVASMQGVEGNWPTDYWRTSWRELATNLPNNDLAVCPPRIRFREDIAANWPSVDTYSCRDEYLISPFLSKDQAGGGANRSATDFWLLRENYSGLYVPKNCVPYAEVSRPLRGEEIAMSYLLRCTYQAGPRLT